jgi:hypothetical protein
MVVKSRFGTAASVMALFLAFIAAKCDTPVGAGPSASRWLGRGEVRSHCR